MSFRAVASTLAVIGGAILGFHPLLSDNQGAAQAAAAPFWGTDSCYYTPGNGQWVRAGCKWSDGMMTYYRVLTGTVMDFVWIQGPTGPKWVPYAEVAARIQAVIAQAQALLQAQAKASSSSGAGFNDSYGHTLGGNTTYTGGSTGGTCVQGTPHCIGGMPSANPNPFYAAANEEESFGPTIPNSIASEAVLIS